MSKHNYLLTTQRNSIDTWVRELNNMFPLEVFGAYMVGSATRTKDYRDVDVRHIFDDDNFAALSSVVDIGYLNHCVSLWGQQMTGLPIDYQIIALHSKENEEKGVRIPLAFRDRYVNSDKEKTP